MNIHPPSTPVPRLAVLGLVLLALGWGCPLAARGADPELRDLFADRARVTDDSGSARGTTVGASIEPREPRHGGKPGGHSVWLSWTAPATGIVTLETTGSDFDTLVSVYVLGSNDPDKPPFDQLKEVASSDDDDRSLTSVLHFGAEEGTTYEIAIDGFHGATGDARLRWDLLRLDQPPPTILQVPPDRALRVGDAVTLTVGFDAGDDDDVKVAWLFNGDDVLGNETDTLTLPSFQPSNVGRYQLRITTGTVRMTSAPIELQINSEGEITTLARDKLLDAVASALVGSGAAPSLQARPAAPRSPPPRRLAALGLTRGYSGVQIFNTLYAAKEAGEPNHCGQPGGASYWLAYQAPARGTLTLDTEGSSFDTVLAVYTHDGALDGYQSLVPVTCDDNGGADGVTSRLSLETSAGRTYLVVVDGKNGGRGLAHLQYRLETSPAPTAPSLVAPPTTQRILLGQPASFSVEASGTAPLAYQWLKDNAPLPDATAPTLTFAAVRTADAGTYAVRVSNAAGDVTSAPVLLEVLVPPTITVAPAPLTVVEGSPATFSIQASGTAPLTYQWFKDSAPLPDATAPTLTFAAVRTADAGTYAVRVTNAAGDVTSPAVVLSVLVPPTITVAPAPLTVVEGSPASFSVQASGTAPLTYQWFKDSAPLPDATAPTLTFAAVRTADAGAYAVRVSNAAGDVTSPAVVLSVLVPPTITVAPAPLTVVEGSPASFSIQASGTAPLTYQWFKDSAPLPDATAPTLTFAAVRTADAGAYAVRVSNAAGDVTSAPVLLSVLVPPTITVAPAPLTVVEGSPASFSVQASGTAPLAYQWLKDNAPLPDATAPTLTFAAVRTADAGAYTVRVTNAAGDVTSPAVVLEVLVPPTITVAPAPLTVVEGSTASFSVQASGTAPLAYQWLKDSAPLPDATAPTLTFAAVRTADAGAYAVRVSNAAGDVTSPAVVLEVLVPPTITVAPAPLTVVEGSTASFSVQASGTAPLAYQWFKDNAPLPGATAPTLTFAAVRTTDAGAYTVHVSNAAGDVTSPAVVLEVLVPPTITVAPAPLTVVEGSTASFSVQASGTAPLAYQWLKDSAPLPDATAPTLTFAAVRTTDAGAYTVRVSNAAGDVTSPAAVLSVLVPPTITVAPAPLTVVEGSPASFSVQASGTAPLAYQWLKDSAPLPDATAPTLTFAAVRTADAGAYTVRVSNAAGDVISPAVALEVLVPPTITLSPVALTVVEGSPASFSVQASGTAPLTYQWLKDHAPRPDATAPTLTIPAARAADAGTYTVRVSNAAGQALSVPVRLEVGVQMTLAPGNAPGTWMLKLPAYPGMPYRLETAGSWSEGAWQLLAEGVAEGEFLQVPISTGPEAAGSRFFRAASPRSAQPGAGFVPGGQRPEPR